MTNENEEAIKNLKKLKSFHNGSYGTAIDTAIKALEQTELNPSYNSVKSELKPSEDCISRAYIEPIIEELENICVNGDEYILSLLSDIKNAPSVTPKTKIGHWIIIDDCEYFIAECSECGRIEDSRMISEYPYCHCGAKMEVEE